MNVKIDTKEKFIIITLKEPHISANMTERLEKLLKEQLLNKIPHLVLNMKPVEQISKESANILAILQQEFYEKNVSFVICELQDGPEKLLDEMEILEFMNVTPTESEAWDIVQMEEIERELLNDFEE